MTQQELEILQTQLDKYIRFCDENGLKKARLILEDFKIKIPLEEYAKEIGLSDKVVISTKN
ncbi:MAG: hypothetical protein CMB80_20735 [Flammeovirgaceae bacterium]|nr:hypothetical protein [Flammeovirgaceae bacterium]MBE63720.1 hypothetical protein [Flammeovirgaceae bacterium]MBR07100.1 hypothetical protein [Rickettsiales bacterium]|tara:strand:- start:236 stop:418 length:183 start_codon:yes stop_codon:yes gene_type:complete